jgi:RecA-family ATPase
VASLPSTEEWFAQPEPATRWRIEGLVEEGHNLLLGGKTKVSKTTLTVDLARALTNGEERWLDEFALSPPTGQVGWINCEMTEAQFRRWLRSAGVNPSRLSVLDLRGNVPNFLDPDWWREIRDWLVAKDISFLVVDSLRAISAVLATNEPA